MTDFIDNLLTSMSSKFNETNADLQINLNEDKTLKWRGLHNNQYAAVKKRKDIKRSEKSTSNLTTSSSSSTTDDPPLMNDSASVTVNADDVTVHTTDAQSTHEIDTNDESMPSEKCETIHLIGNDTKNTVNIDKMEKINNDKSEKDDDQQRPFRRTLRRKQNADDSNEDLSVLNADKNRKVGLRPKRQSSAGSTSENRSVSPRGKDDDKSNASNANEMGTNRNNIMTRQRGRAKKIDRESSIETQSKNTVDESNESLPKTRNERKNSIANEVDDSLNSTQPTPPKLRRSERMHTSTPSDQKDQITSQQENDRNKTDTMDNHEQKSNEHATRSRKRTHDDKKSQDTTTEIKDEKCIDDKSVPSISTEVDATKAEIEPTTDAKEENSQKNDDIEMIDVSTDANNDDQLSNGSDGANVVARKRGRKPGSTKSKANLKLSMTIATRNSPVKKSPRFTSDESPFVYTIPKKDKVAAEVCCILIIHCLQMTHAHIDDIYLLRCIICVAKILYGIINYCFLKFFNPYELFSMCRNKYR